jgi:hypothetical protein
MLPSQLLVDTEGELLSDTAWTHSTSNCFFVRVHCTSWLWGSREDAAAACRMGANVIRGGALAPAWRENTLRSFQAAAANGATFVEFDVQVGLVMLSTTRACSHSQQPHARSSALGPPPAAGGAHVCWRSQDPDPACACWSCCPHFQLHSCR